MVRTLTGYLPLTFILLVIIIIPVPVLAANTGNISLTIIPPTIQSVDIYVDSSLAGSYPAKTTLELPEGTHEILIKHPSYDPWKTRVLIKKGKTLAITAKLTKSSGTLEINSTPAGADIMIDGIPQGTTPLKVPDIEKGYHTVFLEKTGYYDWTGNKVYVKPGETTRLNIKLNSYQIIKDITPFPTPSPTPKPLAGSMIIKAPQQGYSIDIRSNFFDPTRDALLDGQWHNNVGYTPAYWMNLVPPGSYTVRLRDSGGNIVWCGDAIVTADQTTELNAAIGMLCPICTC